MIFFGETLQGGGPFFVEGGDVIILNEETLMIGTGDRSTRGALLLLLVLLKKLRDTKQTSLRTVIRVALPEERAQMHLDTVFTVVSKRELMVYSPITENEKWFYVYTHPFTMIRETEEKPMTFAQAMRQVGYE